MKISNNPKGLRNKKFKIEKVISNGLFEKYIIRKNKNAAIPKIIKRKSALIIHNRINIKKIKNIDSLRSI
jgi:hypothetical protein